MRLAVLAAVAAGLYYYMSQNAEPPLSAKLSFVGRLGPLVKAAGSGLSLIFAPAIIAVVIAWAAMESKWGTSGLALEANNLFGIKAGPTWKGLGRPFIHKTTQEHQGTPQEITTSADFRKYGSWGESVADALHLLQITDAYKPAWERLKAGDVSGFLQAIDASGYSTAADYAKRIGGALDTLSKITA